MAIRIAPGLALQVCQAILDVAPKRQHYEIRAALDGPAAHNAVCRPTGTLCLPAAPVNAAPGSSRPEARRLRLAKSAHRSGTMKRSTPRVQEVSGSPLLAATAGPHWRFPRRTMGEVLRQAEPPSSNRRQHREIFDTVMAGGRRGAGSPGYRAGPGCSQHACRRPVARCDCRQTRGCRPHQSRGRRFRLNESSRRCLQHTAWVWWRD